MRRIELRHVLCLVGVLAFPVILQAEEVSFFGCIPACGVISGSLVCWAGDVQRLYEYRVGQSTWGPIPYGGPIRIEVEAFQDLPPSATVAMVFEMVADPQCTGEAGQYVWQTLGTARCDSSWVASPVIDLHLPVGTTYYLRTTGFRNFASPAQGCLRVVTSTIAVYTRAWGEIKHLFR